jgi:YidC/Oxa1 family membrane protein insertase
MPTIMPTTMPTNSLNNPTSPASPVGAGRSHLAKPRRRTRLAAILAAAMLSLTPLATAQDAAPDATPATPPAEQIRAVPPASPPAGQPAGQPAEPAPETSVPPAPVTAPAAAPIAAPTTARPLPAPRPIAAPPPQPATDSATDPTDPADPADPADPNAPAPAPQGPTPLGSEDGLDKAFIEFTSLSAGIASISLPDSYNSVGHESHIQLQQIVTVNDIAAVPFAILAIEVNGDTVPMASVAGAPRIWNQASPGVFVAHIDAPDGSPLVRITRAYALNISERYGFTVSTTLENLSAAPVTARVIQTGPIDLPRAENNYAGDKRRIRFGYMQPPELQLGDRTVTVDTDLAPRTDLLGKRITTPSGFKIYPAQNTVWPTLKAQERGHRLSWLAFSDRYFAVAVHPLFDPAAVSSPDDKLLKGLGPIDRLLLNPGAPAPDTVMVVRFNGVPVTLAPGASETHAFGVYAGPMSRPTIRQDALLASLRMPEMVVYNLGGFCAPCTFAWLTDSLMGILRLFHTFTGDWAIAIMLLVVLVRAVLHPVTRWSQIRMQKFGAQMQAMGPKQAKLKEKYKDEPKKLQQEMAKLWKEEGISPAGMLGCLPMFLQSPVWIALYATLFFAIELRQEPAFYGIFQTLTNGSWQFLADLAEPDHAIPLPFSQSIPLWGTVSAVNILPLLLGVVFYAHQKFLTPPTSASMTPEQIQQQKIIKVMMVVMFPLMMYAAPSGLALYFITNSVLGIFEHKWIRAHMDKHGMLDPEKIKAERQTKGPGFMARMSEAAETQRKIQAQAHGGRPPLIPDKKRNKKKK